MSTVRRQRLTPSVPQQASIQAKPRVIGAALAGAALLLAGVACEYFGTLAASSASRCAEGFAAIQARCCAPGQAVVVGHCVGNPTHCAEGWQAIGGPVAGCVWVSHPVLVPQGRFLVGPNDWESDHIATREGEVGAFWLDDTEVTMARWMRCVTAGRCAAPPFGDRNQAEPGLPIVNVTAVEAESFCHWATGRLPRSDEWLRAATGPTSRRFPWGQTGLVCRRATFGLARGPCAEAGVSADFAASRPDGKTESGLYDLVGNVAEIVKDPAGGFELRGGSYRSEHAAALKSWSSVPYAGSGSDVGFRCAYDRAPDAESR